MALIENQLKQTKGKNEHNGPLIYVYNVNYIIML